MGKIRKSHWGIIGFAAVLALGGGAAAVSAPTASDWKTAGGPCAHEDSNGCYWDAAERSNGIGRSFTASDAGIVTYWDGKP
jgi:hypothetical protein